MADVWTRFPILTFEAWICLLNRFWNLRLTFGRVYACAYVRKHFGNTPAWGRGQVDAGHGLETIGLFSFEIIAGRLLSCRSHRWHARFHFQSVSAMILPTSTLVGSLASGKAGNINNIIPCHRIDVWYETQYIEAHAFLGLQIH